MLRQKLCSCFNVFLLRFSEILDGPGRQKEADRNSLFNLPSLPWIPIYLPQNLLMMHHFFLNSQDGTCITDATPCIVLAAPSIMSAAQHILSAAPCIVSAARNKKETFGQHQVQLFFFSIFQGEKINFSKTAQNCLKIILEQ